VDKDVFRYNAHVDRIAGEVFGDQELLAMETSFMWVVIRTLEHEEHDGLEGHKNGRKRYPGMKQDDES